MNSEIVLLKTSLDLSMLKDPETLGQSSLTGSLTMYVEHEDQAALYLAKAIGDNLLSTLRSSNSFPEGDISITQDDPTKLTTIVISFGPKKTPEKNGVQLLGEQ